VLPYCPKAQEPDSQIKGAFHDLRELKVNVVTPREISSGFTVEPVATITLPARNLQRK
jgi:hypothetical protein